MTSFMDGPLISVQRWVNKGGWVKNDMVVELNVNTIV